MSFANKKLLRDILDIQTNRDQQAKELVTLKSRFKESDEAKKAKEWAYKEETQKKFDGVLSDFFLKNRIGKEIIV